MAKASYTFKVGHSKVMLGYLAAFFLIWAIILFAFTASLAADHSFFVVVPSALLILEISVAVRAMRVAVWDDPEADRLVVRNYFGTLRIQRRSMREINTTIAGDTSRIAVPVQAVTRDGKAHPVDVFTRPLLSTNARQHHADALERLRRWARSGK